MRKLFALAFLVSACVSQTPAPPVVTLVAAPSLTPTSVLLQQLDAQATLSYSATQAQAAAWEVTSAARAVIAATEQAQVVTAQWRATVDTHALDVTATSDALSARVAEGQATAEAMQTQTGATREAELQAAQVAEARERLAQARESRANAQAIGQFLLVGVPLVVVVILLASGGVWLRFYFKHKTLEHYLDFKKTQARVLREAVVEFDGRRFIPDDAGRPLLLPPVVIDAQAAPVGESAPVAVAQPPAAPDPVQARTREFLLACIQVAGTKGQVIPPASALPAPFNHDQSRANALEPLRELVATTRGAGGETRLRGGLTLREVLEANGAGEISKLKSQISSGQSHAQNSAGVGEAGEGRAAWAS